VKQVFYFNNPAKFTFKLTIFIAELNSP